jgi:oxygen-dependent protoporphyrinogen oxidase
LYKDLIITSKNSPAARNRYIYYPDHLVRMPALEPNLTRLEFMKKTLETLWNEPVFDKLFTGILHDIYTQPRHATEWAKDESVAEFIGRRFHPKIADNLVSAVYHGIYAGDIDQLSAQMLMGSIRDLEGGTGGVGSFVPGGIFSSMVHRAFSRKRSCAIDDYLAVDAISGSPELSKYQHDLERIVAKASTFTFKNGVGQLIDALVTSLKRSGKVKIIMNSDVRQVASDPTFGLEVCLSRHPCYARPVTDCL